MNVDSFGLGSIALGGAIAAIAAFWNQFKTAARQVSSILVVQAHLNSSVGNAAINNLKSNYKKVPSGISIIHGLWMPFKNRTDHLVPFRVLPSTSIWYGKRRLLLLSKSEDVTLISIRGLCDLDQFLVESCRLHEQEISNQDLNINRFSISTFVGCEKGPWARPRNTEPGPAGGAPPDNSGLRATAVSGGSLADPLRDESLCYDRDEYVITNQVDPLEGLFYDPEILAYLEEAKQWKASQTWYQERAIPWKRGWLIHGPGGTGKSSFAQVVAKTMRVPLYNFVLSTMSDQEFITAMQERIYPPCVVLFEDFDTVFDKREPLTDHKSLTFDCVLNQISGVKTLNGVFLIVTTNHIDKIDCAMGVTSEFGSISTRPGRIDQVIHLGVASERVRNQIAHSILKDWPELCDEVVKQTDSMTAVQVQEHCIQRAFTLINQRSAAHDVPVS